MLAVLLCVVASLAGEDLAVRLGEIAAQRSLRIATDVPAIPSSAYDEALAGGVPTGLVDVEGFAARRVWGVGIVDVPIERMWAAVNDDRSKPEWTQLSHVELLDGAFCSPTRRVFQYLDVSIVSDRWWVVDQRMNLALATASGGSVREVTWKSVDDMPGALTQSAAEWASNGVPVAFTQGAWFLISLGEERTLVEYTSFSDPGGRLPRRFASSFAAGGIENTIRQMEKLARRGPTCL